MSTKIWNSIKKLDVWIEKNGWAGYDPYDIKEIPIVLRISEIGNKTFLSAIVREMIFELFYSFPLSSRKLLDIKKKINPKAMGLLAKAYLNLYQITKNQKYVNQSLEVIDWLEENYSLGYSGKCWGYPFHWQSKKFIPRGTPSGVVTSIIGDSFWTLYKITKDKQYLEICKSICQFFIKDLNIDKINDDHICFSYTPITNDHIHNANLFVAEFLMRIGAEIHNKEYIDFAVKSMNYSLSHQNSDGSFYYYGPLDPIPKWIDHYHTGFVLRSLYSIFNITSDKKLYMKIEKCYNHYIANLFERNTIPKFQPNRIYPIDIHSCSEAILCLSELSQDFLEGLVVAENVANWTIDNLQDEEGYFYDAKRRSRFIKKVFTSKIPYMRWGQAWMLLALSTFLKLFNLR
ncbi:MAG: hypothetical protein ACFFDN_04405 [Candidatus Hodarchaeota archaeon]